MRFFPVFLLLVATAIPVQAIPHEINNVSPDKAWIITAQWTGDEKSGAGYAWELRNVSTGKIYFHDRGQDDEVLPTRFDVIWSPNSRYAALDIYYGRAMQDTMVITLTGDTPELVDPLRTGEKTPLEKTLIRTEDIDLYQGYNRLLSHPDHWINNTSLAIEIDMLAFLEDKKSGKKYMLSTVWQKIVNFDKKSPKVIARSCESYDKQPEKN